jgi:hypothetical protein
MIQNKDISEGGEKVSAVYCYRENCKYRSKRKSQRKNRNGEPLFKCTRETLVITEYVPGDGLDYSSEKVSECLYFEKKEQD